tara:strand:+ start:3081 stop:5447 length:2367 start_codon:yes stop_codon:yes gene_type:complete
MTTKHVQQYKLDNNSVLAHEQIDSSASVSSWVRNPSWLTMPAVTAEDEKIVALVAVYEDTPINIGQVNNIFTSHVTDAPLYWRVDWGSGVDEVTRLINTNHMLSLNHLYNYTDSFLSGTNAPVTLSTTEIQRSAHGHTNGMEIKLYDLIGPTNIREAATYYVVNTATNSFQIAESVGGTPIVLNATGTANLLPHKQAIVTVTCEGGIEYLTVPLATAAVDNVILPGQAGHFGKDTNVLEMSLSLPYASYLSFSSVSYSNSHYYADHRSMEQISIYNCGKTTAFRAMFSGMYNLASIPVFNIPETINSFTQCFSNCTNLEVLPDEIPNSKNVSNTSFMFYQCTKLKKAPEMDLSSVVNASYMFHYCYKMKSVPSYNFQSLVEAGSMFSICPSLVTLRNVNFGNKLTDVSSMLNGCPSLTSVPSFGLEYATSLSHMFYNCPALTEVPVINAPNAVITTNMFRTCSGLSHIEIHVPKAAETGYMFYDCKSLKSLRGTFNSVVSTIQMFYNCYALTTLEHVSFTGSKPRDASTMFGNCRSLAKIPYIDFSNCGNAVNIFTSCSNLEDLSQLTFTNKLKVAGGMFGSCYSLKKLPQLDLSNAVTVEGLFTHCYSLTEFPPILDLQEARIAYNMFYNCYSMQYAPKLNFGPNLGTGTTTASSSSLTAMFRGCSALKYIPAIPNTQNITNLSLAFYQCYSLKEIPAMDLSGLTIQSNNDFNFSYSLLKFNVTAYSPNVNLYLHNGALNSTRLDEVYTMLPDLTGLTGRTITVGLQPGRTGDTPTIATNKNWTVTG